MVNEANYLKWWGWREETWESDRRESSPIGVGCRKLAITKALDRCKLPTVWNDNFGIWWVEVRDSHFGGVLVFPFSYIHHFTLVSCGRGITANVVNCRPFFGNSWIQKLTFPRRCQSWIITNHESSSDLEEFEEPKQESHRNHITEHIFVCFLSILRPCSEFQWMVSCKSHVTGERSYCKTMLYPATETAHRGRLESKIISWDNSLPRNLLRDFWT